MCCSLCHVEPTSKLMYLPYWLSMGLGLPNIIKYKNNHFEGGSTNAMLRAAQDRVRDPWIHGASRVGLHPSLSLKKRCKRMQSGKTFVTYVLIMCNFVSIFLMIICRAFFSINTLHPRLSLWWLRIYKVMWISLVHGL